MEDQQPNNLEEKKNESGFTWITVENSSKQDNANYKVPIIAERVYTKDEKENPIKVIGNLTTTSVPTMYKKRGLNKILGIAIAALGIAASAYAGTKEEIRDIDKYVRENPSMVEERSINGAPAGKVYLYKKGNLEIECTDQGIVVRKYGDEANKLDSFSCIDKKADGTLDALVKSPANVKKEWHKMAEAEAWLEPSVLELKFSTNSFFKDKMPNAGKVTFRLNPKNKSVKFYSSDGILEQGEENYNALQQTYGDWLQKVKKEVIGEK